VSYIGVIASTCLDVGVLPAEFTRIEQLEGIPQDPRTSVVACSRNGWLNNRIREIVEATGVSCLPIQGRAPVVLHGAPLIRAASELHQVLNDHRGDPTLLSDGATDYLSSEEIRAILDVVPGSLAMAIERFSAVDARHEDGEHLELLFALLWCQLRLIEHARDHHLYFLSTVWPNDG